jgi:hypothetical protein
MERRKFTRDFKLEAVWLIKDRGVSYVQASFPTTLRAGKPVGRSAP